MLQIGNNTAAKSENPNFLITPFCSLNLHVYLRTGNEAERRYVVKKVIGITEKSSDAAAWCFQFSASDSKDKKTIFSSHVPKDF